MSDEPVFDAVHGVFQVHLLNEAGVEKARRIAEAFANLLAMLQAHCQPGREMALVVTKLEEACAFAKRAMANNPAHQKESTP